ncbi:MAG: lamin tail domain-containing protein, partial [Hymenobacter sp.]
MRTTTPLSGWRSLRQFLPSLLLLLLPLLVRGQSANIVISQVYGGGGSAATSPTPAFKQDYVELFNRSTTPQAIGGYTLQYASATGTSFDVSTAFPAGTTIPAGGYFLVALSTTANSNGSVLPTPDFTPTATLTLAATAGKVALVNGSTPLPATSSATGPTIIDFVGYGTAANTFEGSNPTSNLSTILAAFRSNGGCMDTNQNGADFTAIAPSPRNASNTRPLCTDPVLVANPSALSLSATTGQVAPVATYTLTGYNLAANAAVTISSSNAAVLVSTTGAVGSFASTASVTTSASGELSQTISVQFTAPATAGTTSATISNSGNGKNGSVLVASVAVTGASIMAYTWNGTSTSYSAAGSWTPARTTLTTSDILLFDGAVTPTAAVTLDYNPAQTVPAQTIGQLQFINNVAATLSTDMSRTLTLDNNMPGDDFVIRAGSSVTITNNSTAGTSGFDILLTSPETGAVGGTLLFAGLTGTTNGRHTLQATAAGAVQFVAGSLFQVASTYTTANPFGGSSANAGSVVFRNGARFEQYGGGNPFALTAPNSVVVFEPASTFLFGMSGSAPSLAGRTYGNFIYDVSGASTASGTAGALTIQGDLAVRNGTVSISGTGSIAVQGNVQVA